MGLFNRIRSSLAIGAQKGFARSLNLLYDIVESIEGEDGVEIVKSGTRWKVRLSQSDVQYDDRVLNKPQPFDLDKSDENLIAVKSAVVTTGYMVGDDAYPVLRVLQFHVPAPIECSSAPDAGEFTLWYLMTQVESELASESGANCKLSVDPDADDPNHLLFRKPLYVLNMTERPDSEGNGRYHYVVVMDLRNSTLVRLS